MFSFHIFLDIITNYSTPHLLDRVYNQWCWHKLWNLVQMQCVSKSARWFSDHKTIQVRPIRTVKLLSQLFSGKTTFCFMVDNPFKTFVFGLSPVSHFPHLKVYGIPTLVSNINFSFDRKSPRFSLCPAFPVSFYHPAVWPVLHPPNHPLPPPPWTGSPEGICAVCLCWRLGASRWTGEACYQTVKVRKLLTKPGICIFQILIKVHNPPKTNRFKCFKSKSLKNTWDIKPH